MAAEIITAYPDKQVTLVHSGAYLLAPKGAAYGKKALNFLTSKGVKVCWLAHVLHEAGAAKPPWLLALHTGSHHQLPACPCSAWHHHRWAPIMAPACPAQLAATRLVSVEAALLLVCRSF